jgi:hypothetical protein
MIRLSCAGNNANTIHYIEPAGGEEAGDLLLMDSGTEYHGYSMNCWNDSSLVQAIMPTPSTTLSLWAV